MVAALLRADQDSSTLSTTAQSYLSLLSPSHSTCSSLASERLDSLRQLILLDSLPSDPAESKLIRPLVWKLLLHLHVLPPSQHHHHDQLQLEDGERVHPLLSAERFYELCMKPPSLMLTKIRNDSFRTLATDQQFKDKVGEERLVRLLESFVWRQLDNASHLDLGHKPPIDPATPYVQGMNVLAAPFLFVLPSQLEAFACFSTFIETQAPRYVRPTLEGVHAGLHLVDLSLQSLDPTLYSHLLSHNLTAEIYAFPSLLTFSACTPPLDEVIQLWDFLLAFGVGLNVLCVVAQLWIMRKDLLESNSPMKLLRTFPPLRTCDIIPLAVQFVTDCPSHLYDMIVRHPWDDSLVLDT